MSLQGKPKFLLGNYDALKPWQHGRKNSLRAALNLNAKLLFAEGIICLTLKSQTEI
jgi:hypothetical protein